MSTFIELIKAILYGIVEGITEWLPVSSTGHLILLEDVLSFSFSEDATFMDEFYQMFQVVIQLGAILAVVVLFWHTLWPFPAARVQMSASRPGGCGAGCSWPASPPLSSVLALTNYWRLKRVRTWTAGFTTPSLWPLR